MRYTSRWRIFANGVNSNRCRNQKMYRGVFKNSFKTYRHNIIPISVEYCSKNELLLFDYLYKYITNITRQHANLLITRFRLWAQSQALWYTARNVLFSRWRFCFFRSIFFFSGNTSLSTRNPIFYTTKSVHLNRSFSLNFDCFQTVIYKRLLRNTVLFVFRVDSEYSAIFAHVIYYTTKR